MSKKKYESLQDELMIIEKQKNIYLSDPVVDLQNCSHVRIESATDSDYIDLYYSAIDAAAVRAEGYGLDINDLLGRVVY